MPARKTVQERAQAAAAKMNLSSAKPEHLHGAPPAAPKAESGVEDELGAGMGGGEEVEAEPEGDPLAQAAAKEELEHLREENAALKKGAQAVPAGAWDAMQRAADAEAKVKELQSRLDNSPAHQQETAQWQGKDVRLMLPWWKLTNPMTALSVCAFALQYGKEKLGIIPRFGDSMIYNIRNALADQFLESGATWSFWLDDDVIAPFGAPKLFREFTGLSEAEFPDHLLAVNAVEQLKSHPNVKIVGGVYFGRRAKSPPMFGKGMNDLAAYQAAKRGQKGLIETDWVATGCLMVHRDVFLDIRKKFPSLCPKGDREVQAWGFVYNDPEQNNVEVFTMAAWDVPHNALNIRVESRMVKLPGNPSWQYFQPEPGRGEDVMFCARARAAGHKVYADPAVACLHVGQQAFGLHNVTYPQFENVPVPAGLPAGAVFPGQHQQAATPQLPQPSGPTGTVTPQQSGIPGMPQSMPSRMGER